MKKVFSLFIASMVMAVFGVLTVPDAQAREVIYAPVSAYDLAGAGSYSSSTTLPFSTQPRGLHFSNDGTQLFINDHENFLVRAHDLGTAWDITTMAPSTVSTSTQGNANSFTMNTDGTKMYLGKATGGGIEEYDLSPAWDITSSAFVQATSSMEELNPYGMVFSYDGTQLFFSGNTQDGVIYEYALGTGYDLSTAAFVATTTLGIGLHQIHGLEFNPNGSKLYIEKHNGSPSRVVYEYELSAPYDISSAATTSSTISAGGNVRGITWGNDGRSIYLSHEGDTEIRQYDVTSASDYVFTENAANDGSATGTMYVYLRGDTFTGTYGTPITNLPASLVANFTAADNNTRAILTLTGNADTHTSGENITDLTFDFAAAAFTGGAGVTNATGDYGSGFNLTFTDAASLAYSGSGFTENNANDGSVDDSIVVTLTGDTFISGFSGANVTLGNVPAGLTPAFALSSGDTVLTVTLTGNATDHEDTDDVADITFVFADSAFASTSLASNVTNATGPASSGLGIDFVDAVLVRVNNNSGWIGSFVCSDPEADNYQSDDGANRHRNSECLYSDDSLHDVIDEEETGATHTEHTSTLLKHLLGKLKALHARLVEQLNENSAVAAVLGVSRSCSFDNDLRIGDEHADVKALQAFLNAEGYTVSATAVGAPGMESDYFGVRTELALIAFQEAHAQELLAPHGLRQGSGVFGPATRAKVESLCQN